MAKRASTSPTPPPPGTRVTLKHVAEHAGVSVSTVSDIVNRGRSHQYTPGTQELVQAAIRTLGYRPARAAQELRRGWSNTAGVILTHGFDNPYYARLFSELKTALEQRGLDTEMVVLNQGRAESLRSAWERMLTHSVNGLIVGPLYYWDKPLLDELASLSEGAVPMVAFGAVEDIADLETVVLPDHAGGQVAANYLLDAGHRRIAFLGAYDESEAMQGRGTMQKGFEEVLKAAGLLDRGWMIPSPDSGRYDTGFADAGAFGKRWLATAPGERPTAILCKTDQLAIAALAALHRLGIQVPGDLSVMGYDNVPESGYTVPALTTVEGEVSHRMEEIALRLASRIGGEGAAAREAVIQAPRLVVRDSVRSCSA